MMQQVSRQCEYDYHGSDFMYYCLYRDCDQTNRYICQNCLENRTHEHNKVFRGNATDDVFQHVVQMEQLEQQLYFDYYWLCNNIGQIMMMVMELQDIKMILITQQEHKRVIQILNLQTKIFKMIFKFNRHINLKYFDEQELNQLIKDMYLHSEYREACNLFASFNDDQYLIPYFSDNHKYPKQYFMVFNRIQQIQEKLVFIGSRKFNQYLYQYQQVPININQLRTSNFVQISQNEQNIAYSRDRQLNLVTIGSPTLLQYKCDTPIQYIEFNQSSNSFFLQQESKFRLVNYKTMKNKFIIFTVGDDIQNDKYSILISSKRKINCYNKQSRKLIWKCNIKNYIQCYETKNQIVRLICLIDKQDKIQIIDTLTKKRIILQGGFRSTYIIQMKIQEDHLYILLKGQHAQLIRYNIRSEQSRTNQIQTYTFKLLQYFCFDNQQNVILFLQDRISFYDKNFILYHQLNQMQFKIYFGPNQLELRQQSKNLTFFVQALQRQQKKKTNEIIMFHIRRIN